MAVVLIALSVCVAAACGSVRQRSDDATAAAREFYGALAHEDGQAACMLLAPRTREEVDRDGPCAREVLAAGVPVAPGQVREAVVYGDQAQVVTGADTAFLALVSGRWRVTAAGCTPRPPRPYDCELAG